MAVITVNSQRPAVPARLPEGWVREGGEPQTETNLVGVGGRSDGDFVVDCLLWGGGGEGRVGFYCVEGGIADDAGFGVSTD